MTATPQKDRPALGPYIAVYDAAAAIDFYKKAFGATENYRLAMPSGQLGHAELTLGGSVLMLSDAFPEMGVKGPDLYGGSPVALHLYVDDADAALARALKAGAEEVRPVTDEFHGHRSAMVKDPFGYTWHLTVKTEDVSPEEMQRRLTDMMGG